MPFRSPRRAEPVHRQAEQPVRGGGQPFELRAIHDRSRERGHGAAVGGADNLGASVRGACVDLGRRGAPLELGQSRSSSSVAASPSVSASSSADDYHHRMHEQQRRVQNVVRWCESFGPVKKVETKEDGSLHVYWKDWEVADMVSALGCAI